MIKNNNFTLVQFKKLIVQVTFSNWKSRNNNKKEVQWRAMAIYGFPSRFVHGRPFGRGGGVTRRWWVAACGGGMRWRCASAVTAVRSAGRHECARYRSATWSRSSLASQWRSERSSCVIFTILRVPRNDHVSHDREFKAASATTAQHAPSSFCNNNIVVIIFLYLYVTILCFKHTRAFLYEYIIIYILYLFTFSIFFLRINRICVLSRYYFIFLIYLVLHEHNILYFWKNNTHCITILK